MVAWVRVSPSPCVAQPPRPIALLPLRSRRVPLVRPTAAGIAANTAAPRRSLALLQQLLCQLQKRVLDGLNRRRTPLPSAQCRRT